MNPEAPVKPLPDWKLEVAFSDGTRGVLSIKDRLFGSVFEPLKDVVLFEQVQVDEFGAVCWPTGPTWRRSRRTKR